MSFYLTKRIKTGITYLFISIYFILKNEILFDIYMIFISLFCFWEFLFNYNISKTIRLTVIYFSIISLMLELYYKIIDKNIIISLILFPIVLLIYYINSNKDNINVNNNDNIKIYEIFFGWIYIEIPFFIVRYVYSLEGGKNIIIGLIILIWINDNIYHYLINNISKIKNFQFLYKYFDEKIEILGYNIIYSLLFGFIFYFIGNYNYDWLILSILIPLLIPISNLIYKTIIINNKYYIKYNNNILPGYNSFLEFFKTFIIISPIILGIFYI